MAKNKYEELSIIKYREMGGLKRTLYGLITEVLNENCLGIMEANYPFSIYHKFLDPKTTSTPIEIIKELDSLKEIPEGKNIGIDTEKEMFKKLVNLYRNADKRGRKTIGRILFYLETK